MRRETKDFLVVLGISAGIAFATGAFMMLMSGCIPASAPEPPLRASARAAVLAIAQGVREADRTCSTLAIATLDIPLAERCGHSYQAARRALLAAEAGLDAADTRTAACAAAPAARALAELTGAVQLAGGPVPPAVVDGAEMAVVLARLVPCADGGAI